MNNKEIKEFNSRDYSENLSNLKIKSENFLESQDLKKQLETKDSKQNVRDIFSEVTKEVKVISINGQSTNTVVSTQKKLKPQDRNQFKAALRKIQSFGTSSSGTSPRTRKGRSTTPRIESLSTQEKKSISDFFTQFESLDKSKGKYSKDLSQASGEVSVAKLTQQACLSCIPGDLRKIGWVNQEMNTFEKTPSYRSHPSLPHIYYQNNSPLDPTKAQSTWGQWSSNNHPYRHFFSSEDEWKQSLKQISDYWTAYYQTMNSRAKNACAVITMPIGNVCRGDKSSLEQGINDAKASLELKIGTKLMNLMERL